MLKRTGLKRMSPLRPRRRRVSRVTGPDPDTRSVVWMRAGGRCERCGEMIGNGSFSVHHRKPRRMGGSADPTLNTAGNLLLLCGSGVTGCHGWVESNRTASYGEGWLLHSGQNPESVPARIHGLGFRLLTGSGGYRALWD